MTAPDPDSPTDPDLDADASEDGDGDRDAGSAGHDDADRTFDPFAEVFQEDGRLDREFVQRNVHVLVAMLRRSADCYAIRLDFEQLAGEVESEAGSEIRAARNEEEFQLALQSFSSARLHALVPDEVFTRTEATLRALAGDAELRRKRRLGAAIGLGLLGGLPDEHGLRGRGLFDLVLRVTFEELNAQEQLRRRAAESEGGLTADELSAFWDQYPALRHHYEQRYRRDVAAVLQAIEDDRMPTAVSIDLALRGAYTLLREMELRREGGVALEADECHRLLRDCYDQDFLDGGLETLLERWTAGIVAAQRGEGSGSAEDLARTVDVGTRALRIVGTGGPGGDIIVFSAYVRAVVEGSFYVRDAAEADVAKGIFAHGVPTPESALAYAEHLGTLADRAPLRRVLLAGVELWPEDEGIREAARKLAEADLARARKERQGPRYDEPGVDEP